MSEEDDQRQSDIPDFHKWDGYISGKRNYRLNPLPTEKEVLAKYFEIRPTVDSDNLCLDLIVLETGRKKETVANIIHKHFVKEEAKAQRKQIAEEIYADKIPAIQSIIGLSLSKLENFVTGFTPANIEDAKGLSKIATDLNGILRLELGKSTQNIEVVQRTEKSVTVLLEELKQNDPFVEYPALPHDSKK